MISIKYKIDHTIEDTDLPEYDETKILRGKVRAYLRFFGKEMNVGYCGFETLEDKLILGRGDELGMEGEYPLIVRPFFRKKGIGTKLTEKTIELAAELIERYEMYVKTIEAYVYDFNETGGAAMNILRRLGFSYIDTETDDHRFQRDLIQAKTD